MRRWQRLFWFTLWVVELAALAGAPFVWAQQGAVQAGPVDPETVPRPEMRAAPAGMPITIDGRLDEEAWGRVSPITTFIQAQPDTGRPATERTEVRLLYDKDYLYIGAVCYDSEPDRLVVKTLERDFPGVISEDMDSFGFSLDTFLDRRNSFIFFINPRGGIKDGQAFNDGTIRDYGWDAILDLETEVNERGYTVEIAIPWTTLRFDPTRDDQTWGVNFLRRIRRKNEVSYWAPLDQRNRIFLVSQAGTLYDLPRGRQSRNLNVKPFALARRSTGANLPGADVGSEADGGLDVKWGITPRTTLDLTWRTDFSQADVDREQVNLTRFPVFFPERRDFFLENSGIFTLGDVTAPGGPRSGTSLRDFTLFHSRTIGLKSGRPVPLFGGARLTGRAGAFEFGLLNVQSKPFEEDPAENFTTMRLRRNFLGRSDIGFLFTNRMETGEGSTGYNRSFGTDLNMRLKQSVFINSYLAFTDTQGVRDGAARLAVGWRDRLWDTSAMFRHVGANFIPGMGFIRRRGIRQYYATFGARPRPSFRGILELNPYAEADYITDLAGDRVSWDGTLGFGVRFRDGGRLSVRYDDRRERLDVPFRVRPGVSIPIGDYHFGEAAASFTTSEGRKLSGSVGVSGGGYFDGKRFTMTGSVLWQPDYHLTTEVSVERNSLDVQGSEFTADLYAARVKYAFTTKVSLGAFFQYNADIGQVVTNVRFRFIHAPLSDLFVVLTERRDVAGGVVLERIFTVKFTRLFRF